MTDLGIDALERLNRRNLRALEHDTAAQSGLRLAGYDRPFRNGWDSEEYHANRYF